ncbi:MAG: 4Fe-4S binding protein [Deltaproteobacteria bacterium]|nr:4Fe-4S binding protein [Deltaproteobacteria bacterium]
MQGQCELKIIHRQQVQQRQYVEDLQDNYVPAPGLDEDAALREAGRCLASITCHSCDLCRFFCPDLCITRNKETGHIEIDYDYCKGCGLCAFICPKEAISMVPEE